MKKLSNNIKIRVVLVEKVPFKVGTGNPNVLLFVKNCDDTDEFYYGLKHLYLLSYANDDETKKFETSVHSKYFKIEDYYYIIKAVLIEDGIAINNLHSRLILKADCDRLWKTGHSGPKISGSPVRSRRGLVQGIGNEQGQIFKR